MCEMLRIALADDEPHMRAYLRESLLEMGHTVVSAAATGRELVDCCRATKPDLILTDIRMPDMDGIEAAMEICREEPTPVVLLSALHDPFTIQRAGADCVMAYLVKPIVDADLAPTLTVAMHRFRELAAARLEAAELRQVLEDRKIVERAKGMLMKLTGIDEEQAHLRLQTLASYHSMKLVEACRMILALQSAFEPPPAARSAANSAA